MNPSIKENINELKILCQRHKVEALSVFGSVVTKNFDSNSDMDFLVRFSDSIPLLDYADNYFNLLDNLKELFKRDIDLVTEKSLKNPVLIDEIYRTRVSIL